MLKSFILIFLNLFSNTILILFFIRIILSLIPKGLMRLRLFVFNVTEPILSPIRKIVHPIGGVIDLSPLIFYIILDLIIFFVDNFM